MPVTTKENTSVNDFFDYYNPIMYFRNDLIVPNILEPNRITANTYHWPFFDTQTLNSLKLSLI